jgi:hypothetical protein
MTAYDAQLQIEGESTSPVPVVVDLTDERLTMSIGQEEVADWARTDMRIQALPDGFHIRAEAEFAVELGLRNAHPALRQKMAALMRSSEEV